MPRKEMLNQKNKKIKKIKNKTPKNTNSARDGPKPVYKKEDGCLLRFSNSYMIKLTRG